MTAQTKQNSFRQVLRIVYYDSRRKKLDGVTLRSFSRDHIQHCPITLCQKQNGKGPLCYGGCHFVCCSCSQLDDWSTKNRSHSNIIAMFSYYTRHLFSKVVHPKTT